MGYRWNGARPEDDFECVPVTRADGLPALHARIAEVHGRLKEHRRRDRSHLVTTQP